ncbi:GNAT family N-acetyltransferase [Agrococcus casei]|uniref:GNAT family N-acetyltransferase n=1 Tax=Agrococcus casei TaxID=343512 RepID=UPI003F8F1BA3
MSAAPLAGPSLPVLGGKVVLTALRESDVERMVEACSTDDAHRFLETPWPYQRSDAEFFIREFAPGGWRGEHDERVWAIRERVSGPLAGVIGLREDEREVGFWLHPDAMGRGLMTDALRTLVGHAEGCLVWAEVHWNCYEGNITSMRVAKAAGFTYLGLEESTTAPDPARASGRERKHYAVITSGGDVEGALPWPDLA